ncbi:GNAT family N-acetyltransferase [Vibrio sp. SNU_ST1]|uniref:GNAT family N-acetyltransferase n=1 Tax=Vibrio sp. SNU_ST1 TaxID=3064001 RepID=UPI00272C5A4A|nr:GNAT family N-acetyltransferase [Vibrio sp. SNU_ST1]WKY60722.1 GNAT family N-acetyltransferase [Vibrio sp. SNU_ST1]
MKYSTRPAQSSDYEFLFELKKAAEFEPIKAVFGWDEQVQRDIHAEEWAEKRPEIIEYQGKAIGSVLLQDKGDHFYLCRFFLLPEYHGKGIGSQILTNYLAYAEKLNKPVELCYLQGNRVGGLYRRFGFEMTSQNDQFVYMCFR